MPTFHSFTEIEAWQKARVLTSEICSVSKKGAFAKDFELRGQIRSASISVMSNIAEGFDRNGTAEFIQFLAIAKGSVAEVASQLFVAKDQNYVTAEEFDKLIALTTETGRKIGALMNYLRRSRIKGLKFR
ncbi:MAG TPA: four helix bundle protein [Candidatus Binatia bacterium]|nr:four helix bundle protein [Candidatus Binatia bacterium]